MDITLLQKALDKGDYSQAIYATYMDIVQLLERVNKHSLEQKNSNEQSLKQNEKTFDKIEGLEKEVRLEHRDLRESIYKLELASTNRVHKLDMKIVGWTSLIASFFATAASVVVQLLRSSITH